MSAYVPGQRGIFLLDCSDVLFLILACSTQPLPSSLSAGCIQDCCNGNAGSEAEILGAAASRSSKGEERWWMRCRDDEEAVKVLRG